MSLQLVCPECRYRDCKVIDSRVSGSGRLIRRRRQCRVCGFRWTTREMSVQDAKAIITEAEKVINEIKKTLETL